jgi:hypothetical protein
MKKDPVSKCFAHDYVLNFAHYFTTRVAAIAITNFITAITADAAITTTTETTDKFIVAAGLRAFTFAISKLYRSVVCCVHGCPFEPFLLHELLRVPHESLYHCLVVAVSKFAHFLVLRHHY